MSVHKIGIGAALAAAALTLTACGGDPTEAGASDSDTIVVGSADFTEAEIVAEIYAQALEAKDVKVEKKLRIGAREAYIPALEGGEIDLIPEYTGNLLLYFDKNATATEPGAVEDALDDALPDELETLEPAPAEDKDSYNVTRELSESEGITSIGDLAKLGTVKVGANPEFETRPYGVPGLKKVYGAKDVEFTPISDAGGPATIKALKDGDVDVANIYSTTPSIKANDLVTLEDPENLIAAQNIIPLINDAKSSDVVEDALDAVSAELTTEDLIELNGRVDGDEKASAATVAKEWLEEKGLI
ncbi:MULTISPECIES: ABC transporter substrate-binding protein [unclassified Aeromicrobium]|jgi:osmoprotectant transport system substrate-binding protein|uniref:ABC transporter substrate-binding protein n=1 Tax=unclassified Aeromicrobium TaxID=2633570 RepID=UPI0006F6520B|nr:MULTISPECIES: ABC transporter substrate-binding protein [unclassified Aeromicrobium]KQP27666.1 glycine/betaine ABC transporter [Aeromicrobium sp. Leaf272]KQP78603.1 glycine/betaine ABC transporter [Aeromicrobium sp. Leaf289]KQP84314.1 glycine/betaine ABC transporter [Aeromicrobium sp. Leaf291]